VGGELALLARLQHHPGPAGGVWKAVWKAVWNARARKPSSFGSNAHPDPTGRLETVFAVIGATGGHSTGEHGTGGRRTGRCRGFLLTTGR